MSNLDLTLAQEIHVWADTGNTFRSRQFLTAIGCTLHEQYPQVRETRLHLLCEHHGKGRCDGYFGNLSKLLHDTSCRVDLRTLDDVRKCYQDDYDRRDDHHIQAHTTAATSPL